MSKSYHNNLILKGQLRLQNYGHLIQNEALAEVLVSRMQILMKKELLTYLL
jgi:hypothetical protein